MKIVLVGSEAAPWAVSGGPGEVLGALPAALAAEGLDVSLVVPLHRGMQDAFVPLEEIEPLRIRLHDGVEEARVRRALDEPAGVRVYGIEALPYFDRPSLYGESGSDYADNARRFTVFCRAVLAALPRLGSLPDVIHCHEWQTALIPAYLRGGIAGDDDASRAVAELARAAVVFTVHNIGYTGSFPASEFPLLGLPRELMEPGGLLHEERISLLRGALVHADQVTTVSPTHARELATPEGSAGFHEVLSARPQAVSGILNGIDAAVWNPREDALLAAPFSPDRLAGKKRCKADLLVETDLRGDLRTPILAMVSRLAMQKGFDILLEALPGLLERGARVVALGRGDDRLAANLAREAEASEGRFVFRHEWDEPLAHKVLAGADFLLMPSRYEACGLGQMIAQRYATVPIVTPVGGLADSVIDPGQSATEATGFWMEGADRRSLELAVARALEYRERPTLFDALRVRAMTRDFSWHLPARRYAHLYRRFAERHRRRERPQPRFRIGAEGWRARLGEDLGRSNLDLLVRAVADCVGRRLPPGAALVVGHDGRFLAREFAARAAGILAAEDVRVLFDSEARTLPALALASGAASGGLIVTGGAADRESGGLLLFGEWGGAVLAERWQEIVARAEQFGQADAGTDTLAAEEAERVSLQARCDSLPGYLRSLRGALDAEARGKRPPHVVFDARHGAVGPVMQAVLGDLGLDLPVLNAVPDAAKIGGEPLGSDVSLAGVRREVRRGFDFGVAFSADGSFARVVDASGEVLAPGHVAALLLDAICTAFPGRLQRLGRSIMASGLLDSVARHHGLGIIEAPNGFAELGRMLAGGEVDFAVDERGGISLRRHGAWRDGILVPLLLAEALARDRMSLAERRIAFAGLHGNREMVYRQRPLDLLLVERVLANAARGAESIANRPVVETVDLDGGKFLFEDGSWTGFRVREDRGAVEFWAEAKDRAWAEELMAALQSRLYAE